VFRGASNLCSALKETAIHRNPFTTFGYERCGRIGFLLSADSMNCAKKKYLESNSTCVMQTYEAVT